MSRWSAILGSVLTVVLIILFLIGVKTGVLHPILDKFRQLGPLGIVLAILLLALFCVLPVPSEFVIIWNMEVYGVWFGIFYSWIGGIVGAVGAMYLTRWTARPFIERWVGKYLRLANIWIRRQGSVGLLTIRFIPFLPYHLVNYIAGALRIKFWPFVWTTALGILPFDLAMAGMFAGVHDGAYSMAASGGVIIILLILLGRFFQKKWMNRTT